MCRCWPMSSSVLEPTPTQTLAVPSIPSSTVGFPRPPQPGAVLELSRSSSLKIMPYTKLHHWSARLEAPSLGTSPEVKPHFHITNLILRSTITTTIFSWTRTVVAKHEVAPSPSSGGAWPITSLAAPSLARQTPAGRHHRLVLLSTRILDRVRQPCAPQLCS